MMKIYEIGTGYTPIPAKMGAATEIVVEALTKALLKQGADVEIIDIAAKTRPATALPIREVKVAGRFAGTDVSLGMMHKLKRVVYSVALAGYLKKLLKEAREPVVLHFHNQYNMFFFLLLTSKRLREQCRTVYTNHSGIWRLPWENVKNTLKKRYFQEAICMKHADAVLLLNEETRRKAQYYLHIPADRLHLVVNGVDTQIYCPLNEEAKDQIRTQLNLKGKCLFLQVGSVNENKGQKRVLEYILPLLKADPTVVYGYAGGVVDASYQEQILALAKDQGVAEQVRYFGMVEPGEELNNLYNAAKATVLASQYESFGMVAVESCAAGVPVVAEQTGAVEPIQGMLGFCADNAAAILKAVRGMEGDAYQELCEKCREHTAADYDWGKIAQGHTDVFTMLMSSRKQPDMIN